MQYLERICAFLREGIEIKTWYSTEPFNTWFYIFCPGKLFAGLRQGGLVSFWIDLGDVKTYHFMADFHPNVRKCRKCGGTKLWILPRAEKIPATLKQHNATTVPRRGDFQTELEDQDLLHLLEKIVFEAKSIHTKDYKTHLLSLKMIEGV